MYFRTTYHVLKTGSLVSRLYEIGDSLDELFPPSSPFWPRGFEGRSDEDTEAIRHTNTTEDRRLIRALLGDAVDRKPAHPGDTPLWAVLRVENGRRREQLDYWAHHPCGHVPESRGKSVATTVSGDSAGESRVYCAPRANRIPQPPRPVGAAQTVACGICGEELDAKDVQDAGFWR